MNKEDGRECSEKLGVCCDQLAGCEIPEKFLQIQANNSEMSLRIETLIKCKRLKANEKNKLEFFSREDNGNSCARINATVKCRQGARSHLEVCSVWNAWGPQSAINRKSNPKLCSCSHCLAKTENL